MHSRRRFRRTAVIFTASVVLAAFVGAALPVRAATPDQETLDFIALIDDVQAFVAGLADVGDLGQSLPAVDVAPAGADGLGLADLLSEARTSVLGGAGFDGAATIGQLADRIDGSAGTLADGRQVAFAAAADGIDDGVRTLVISVEVDRTITDARLDISDTDPQFSLASEDGVQLVLSMDATFSLNRDTTTGDTWLTRSATTPALSVDAAATIPNPSGIEAGLGILGITLGAGSTFALDASVTTGWNDPNNDGKLAFDAPGGTPADGELAAPGAGAGLVTAGISSGSLASVLVIESRPSSLIDLAQASVSVNVGAADLMAGGPEVTVHSGSLSDVEAFLTLSPRDLAQGLAQAASAVLSLQNHTAADLPFMRGDLANAIGAVEAIQQFLDDHVPDPAPGDVQPGLPSFVSLQDLLEALDAETGLPGGADMSIADALYDADKRKVNFELGISRAAGAPQALNPMGEPLTGTADYTDTTLEDPTTNFDSLVVGRQVHVGSSAAVIGSVSADGHTLHLDDAPFGSPPPASLWQGGTPANGSTYSIAANDPKIGLVELGDALQGGAVRNANATAATATVDPSYTLTLPIVLDLQAPITSDCDPGSGTATCPFKQDLPESGFSRIISSLPLAAERIMLRTADANLLTANADISTAVEVGALAGFVGVDITGSLVVCPSGPPADCSGTPTADLLSIGLKNLAGTHGADADGDIPVPDFISLVAGAVAANTLGDLITSDVNGQAQATLSLAVPGATDFFGGPAEVILTVPDIAVLDVADPTTYSVTGPQLPKLAALDVDPDNPMALFGALLATLEALGTSLEGIGGPGLDTQIPVVGRSLAELIASGASGSGPTVSYADNAGTTVLTDTARTFDDSYLGRRVKVGTAKATIVEAAGNALTLSPAFDPAPAAGAAYAVDSELQGVLNVLSADPAESLQDLLDVLAAKLGNGSTATFAVRDEGTDKILQLVVDWKRQHLTQAPASFSFDLGGSDTSVLGAEGSGVIDITTTGQVKLTLELPLTQAAVADPAGHLKVDPAGSFVKAGVAVNGDGVRLQANIGPFEASLGNPTGPAGTELRAGLGVVLDSSATSPQPLGTFLSGLDVAVNGDADGDGTAEGASCASAPADHPLALCASFPAFINGQPVNTDSSPDNDAFVVRLPIGSDLGTTLDPSGTVAVGGTATPRVVVPDGLATAIENAAFNLLPFGDGFLAYIEFLEQSLEVASFEGKLPLIGQDLQAGSEFLADLRANVQAAFDAANVPANPTAQDVQDFFNGHVKPALGNPPGMVIEVVCGGAPCTGSETADQIDGVTLTVDIGTGDPANPASCGDPSCSATLPLDLGLPGLSIKADEAGAGITGSLGWALHLKLGLDRTDGFYVHTQDSTTPEFRVGASLNVPDTTAQLAFIKVNVAADKAGEPAEFVGTFSVDLRDGASAPDCTVAGGCAGPDLSRRITLDKLKSQSLADFVKPVLEATLDINWDLRAVADSALPGIGATFEMGWSWGTGTDPPADPGDLGGLHTLAFNNVVIDPGQFLGDTLGPIVNQVVDIFKPIQPILDTIDAPLPVLSDLSRAVGGDDVTIGTLAAAYSTLAGGPDIAPFLEVLSSVRTLVDALSGDCAGYSESEFCLTVGSFNLLPDKVATTDANPATGASLIDDGSKTTNDLLLGDLDGASAGDLQGTGADADHMGFTFPALENPATLFGILVGQDVELVRFDSGPLTLGFDFQLSLGPIYAPPPVNVVIGGGASVSLRVVAGFDTYGIRTAIEAGKVDAQILDSLYFVTTEGGQPIPVVEFEGFVQAGASVSAIIIEVGIVGGVKLTVGFFWNDPNNDGKFRFSEFLTAALTNPICLFNVGGELSLFIKVFITIGFSIFSVSFDFTLVDIKLLDFSLKPDCTPPPPRLGGTKDGVLYLFAGKLGNNGERGDPVWNNGNTADETWVVRQVQADADNPEPRLVVQALGITESFPSSGIHTVVLDGRDYAGSLEVLFQGGSQEQSFDKTAIVFTGTGEDVIRTGEGDAWVDGGGGVDEISTFDRQDLALDPTDPATAAAIVAGGPGDDKITVGNGVDTVYGDRGLAADQHSVTVDLSSNPGPAGTFGLTDAIDPSTVAQPSDPALELSTDGADQIAAGIGGSTIYGGAGNDIIGTANDNPQADLTGIKGTAQEARYRARANHIVGGKGSDRIKSGTAGDTVFTGGENVIAAHETGAGDDPADTNTVDTGEGSDTVYGSNAVDLVTTHSTGDQTATVYGGGADDVIIGGHGTDMLYGGPDHDYLVAQPAEVSPDFPVNDVLGSARRVTRVDGDPITAAKTLVGGAGRDRIYGADGPSTIYGDDQVDACERQTDPVSKQPPETVVATDDDDLIQGGAGVDVVQAGGGNDHVRLHGADDVACGNAGVDTIRSGADDDLVYGGSGGDRIYGESGADELYGNTGNDGIYGDAGSDRIQGNEDVDFAFGGIGADLILGGTSKAGAPDGTDYLFGESGTDTIVGDNADGDSLAASPYPEDLEDTDATLGGADLLWGGDHADTMYGGLAGDLLFGNGGADQIEGNSDADTLFGHDGADNLIGGSSQAASAGQGWPDAGDTLAGGDGDDVIAGDNAAVVDVADGSPLTKGRGLTAERSITLLDQGHGLATGRFGGDTIGGDDGPDVLLGQRGSDGIDGGDGDDYAEGGQDADTLDGAGGQDDLVGGSYDIHTGSGQDAVGQRDAGDTVTGGDGGDVAIGDNGAVLRDPAVPASAVTQERGITARAVALYDLGDAPVALTSGADLVEGDAGNDVLLGQDADDRVLAGTGGDYAEGGQGGDWVEGGSGDDDLVGGSAQILGADTGLTTKGQPDGADVLLGQDGDDLVTGDNGAITRVQPYNDLTDRVRPDGTKTQRRSLVLYDLANDPNGELSPPTSTRFAGDFVAGHEGVDVLLGQDGGDAVSGGSGDDYAEGQGGADTMFGDRSLTEAGVVLPAGPWPGSATAAYDADAGAHGQDDFLGGSSREAFRDGADTVAGDGESDYLLGDNGTIVRDVLGDGPYTERLYEARYPTGAPPAGAAKVRIADAGSASTRFCTTAQATCEPSGASGGDTLSGDAGDDFVYGQDGDDTAYGGADDDDVYGELGHDELFGEDGDDVLLGDRGGIVRTYEDGSHSDTVSINAPPAISYTSRTAGSVTPVVDLLHDVNGDAFVGSGTDPAMPHDGIAFGGDDRIRAGAGKDSAHGGVGDDLINGDSGGDTVFGGDGADVLWGGQGCNQVIDSSADCTGPTARGDGDRFVDYLFGGKGATSGPSVDPAAGSSGSDVIDWKPRGTYGPAGPTTCTANPWPQSFGPVTVDPCSWFEMTSTDDGDAANDQHHAGIDWQYGGWDRDVLQGDVADNGPNPGDRLLDWNGAYNLYSHCNAAYGGFNDVRQLSPQHLDLIQRWAYGVGAGQAASDVTTAGTSAFIEAAIVYQEDLKEHGSGKAYPTTPGHFEDSACD